MLFFSIHHTIYLLENVIINAIIEKLQNKKNKNEIITNLKFCTANMIRWRASLAHPSRICLRIIPGPTISTSMHRVQLTRHHVIKSKAQNSTFLHSWPRNRSLHTATSCFVGQPPLGGEPLRQRSRELLCCVCVIRRHATEVESRSLPARVTLTLTLEEVVLIVLRRVLLWRENFTKLVPPRIVLLVLC